MGCLRRVTCGRRPSTTPAQTSGPCSPRQDWDAFEAIHEYIFRDRLRLNPKDYPIMLSEPAFLPKHQREKVVAALLLSVFLMPGLRAAPPLVRELVFGYEIPRCIDG